MSGWSHQEMADELSALFEDGWLINLGVGLPTLCSNSDLGSRSVIYHAENGVIGYGKILPEGEHDITLVNGAGQHVSLNPGAVVVDHLESFAIIRSGRIDVCVLGAYEVAATGDIANWKIGKLKGGSIGGAMELAAGCKRVFVAMEHTTRTGESRLVDACSLAVTAKGVVTVLVTNLGLFAVKDGAFHLRKLATGISVADVQAATAGQLVIDLALA
jgi:3-oxoacid CoA-transferase B subunit